MQTRTGLQMRGISVLSAHLHAYNEKRKRDRTLSLTGVASKRTAATVRGVIPSSSDAITCTDGNNSGLSQLLLYSVSNPIFFLLVFKVESHGFQEKSPSRYCRHIWVLLCFDLPVLC